MIKHIVFDLGGVLIDWDPRYLYRKIFDTEEEVSYFLTEICDMEWNELQDAGRDIEQGMEERINLYPQYRKEILAYYNRWPEMLGGPVQEVVDLLGLIVQNGEHNLFGITNWSHQTFPIAKKYYSFLSVFQDIVISGVEKVKKPDPKIYKVLLSRQQIDAQDCLFIDDNIRNVKGAIEVGMKAIQYISPKQLSKDLNTLSILKW